ncbi:uncharacterized protein IWZ02DRAFT_10710 [Phyllosticta citriasiana]|uniref:uncharacterized protein n=1 Tax=Phyllosticta citriasiana TaxID=595635 RepID=UPI0030FDCF49
MAGALITITLSLCGTLPRLPKVLFWSFSTYREQTRRAGSPWAAGRECACGEETMASLSPHNTRKPPSVTNKLHQALCAPVKRRSRSRPPTSECPVFDPDLSHGFLNPSIALFAALQFTLPLLTAPSCSPTPSIDP